MPGTGARKVADQHGAHQPFAIGVRAPVARVVGGFGDGFRTQTVDSRDPETVKPAPTGNRRSGM